MHQFEHHNHLQINFWPHKRKKWLKLSLPKWNSVYMVNICPAMSHCSFFKIAKFLKLSNITDVQICNTLRGFKKTHSHILSICVKWNCQIFHKMSGTCSNDTQISKMACNFLNTSHTINRTTPLDRSQKVTYGRYVKHLTQVEPFHSYMR
jgi:hypothetical protein